MGSQKSAHCARQGTVGDPSGDGTTVAALDGYPAEAVLHGAVKDAGSA